MARKCFFFFNRISLAQITADIDAGKGRSVVILEKNMCGKPVQVKKKTVQI